MSSERVAAMRRAYLTGGLAEADVAGDPHTQFHTWFADAVTAGLREPNAMVLATATPDGVPSARLVLLKGYDAEGFTFFTNYCSRKAAELAANPRAALVFPWHDLDRQVRVEGGIAQVDPAENESYFAERPRGSQLGAWASPQSAVLQSREQLTTRLAAVTERFGTSDGNLPVPEFWGGYRVVPAVVEFWQGRDDRLHDRLRYRRANGRWVLERLAP